MTLPDWYNIFSAVCTRSENSLEWGLPEPWVHAELFNELKKQAGSNGWTPFAREVPYITFLPVVKPKESNRDLATAGAVKWVDLCLRRNDENAWCWFEFKVRHAGDPERQAQATEEALSEFRKDVVALIGFDAVKTTDCWSNPDRFTVAYWFKSLLAPIADQAKTGRHYFVSAYLQLGSALDNEILAEATIRQEIAAWHKTRNKAVNQQKAFPDIRITGFEKPLPGGHSLIVCEWGYSI